MSVELKFRVSKREVDVTAFGDTANRYVQGRAEIQMEQPDGSWAPLAKLGMDGSWPDGLVASGQLSYASLGVAARPSKRKPLPPLKAARRIKLDEDER